MVMEQHIPVTCKFWRGLREIGRSQNKVDQAGIHDRSLHRHHYKINTLLCFRVYYFAVKSNDNFKAFATKRRFEILTSSPFSSREI